MGLKLNRNYMSEMSKCNTGISFLLHNLQQFSSSYIRIIRKVWSTFSMASYKRALVLPTANPALLLLLALT